MTRRQLLKIIEEGENLTVEFKQRFSSYEKIAKELIAFANTKGGIILFGIDDNKSIYGVRSEKGENELVKIAAKQYCEPEIDFETEYINVNNKEIVVIKIPESQNKPHRIQDYRGRLDLNTAQVYIRVNDKSVPASKEMIKILQTQSNGKGLKNYGLGKSEKIALNYLETHETITVNDLCKAGNLSKRRASRTLINLVRANLLFIHTKENGENYFSSSI